MHKLKGGKYLVIWKQFSRILNLNKADTSLKCTLLGVPIVFASEPVSYQTIYSEPVHTIPDQ